MKTHYILPALLSLGVAVISSQSIAAGLTYDPVGDYYSANYGVGTMSVEVEAEPVKPFYDPYANYYNTYYDMDGVLSKDQSKKSTAIKVAEIIPDFDLRDYPSMADPKNYFNW